MVAKSFWIIVLTILLQKPIPTVLIFGDSLTAGYGLSPEEAFPAWVEKNLRDKNLPVRMINAGLSGETSAGGLERLNWILRQPIDVFVLELGGNDGLRGLPLVQTKKNLQAIIDLVRKKFPKAKIVIAGMLVPPNLGQTYTTEFKSLYPELARRNNAILIPFLLEGVAGDEKLNQPDGIHPNAEGHKIVGQTVTRYLEPLVRQR